MSHTTTRPRPTPGDFARLNALIADNDRLLARLARLDRQIDAAMQALAEPESTAAPIFVAAALRYWRAIRIGVLQRLRANRIAAREFLDASARCNNDGNDWTPRRAS